MMALQLNLELGDARVSIPWNGVSPRLLTKASKVLFLSQEAQKDDRFFVDPFQMDLFHEAIKKRHRYGGAPLLVPLKGG